MGVGSRPSTVNLQILTDDELHAAGGDLERRPLHLEVTPLLDPAEFALRKLKFHRQKKELQKKNNKIEIMH